MEPAALLGRVEEQRRIAAVVSAARNGLGGALLLEGEPGIGKTALLEAATTERTGVRLLRADGFEAESTLPYAALQRLMIPLRDYLPVLPERHQQALRVAAGVAAGPPPDRFLVGLGVLGLLAAAGEDTPVLCAVDDAHLLDSESLDALALVARRLGAESAALVLASREAAHVGTQMAGVPRLQVAGLAQEAAIDLLLSSVPEPIDPAAAAQIAVTTGGNPLALIDLADELSVKRLSEAGMADEPIPVGPRLEAYYLRRVRLLTEVEQLWLLVAAADSTGDVDLIQATGTALGLCTSAGDAAEEAGLVELSMTARFRHPLVRSAVYGAAPGGERRRVHAALAAAAADLGMVEREAWHAAKATLGTDAAVADRLERVADLAGQRGAGASRASVLAQASALTPEGTLKYARMVTAAEAALAAGAAQLAASMLDEVDERRLDPLSTGRMLMVRASVAVFTGDPALRRSAADMLSAAAAMHGHDAGLEQDTLLQAFYFTLPAERLAAGLTLTELGTRLRDGARLGDGIAATILEAIGAFVLLPYADAVPAMRKAVEAISALDDEGLLKYGPVSIALTSALWDAPARRDCLERTAAAARDTGSLRLLDMTLWSMSIAELKGGTPRRAAQCIEQVRDLRRAIGYDADHVLNPALMAWSGAPREQVESIADGARMVGMGGVQASGLTALAVRDLADGAYADAYALLRPFIDDPFLQVTPLEYPDFVEAAVRSDKRDDALPVVARLEEIAAANGSLWALGAAERCRALVDDDAAEGHFEAALDAFAPTGIDIETARTHLLYGEWLRRARRRRDAREHLRLAEELFTRCEAPAFVDRARRELEASGARAHPAGPAGAPELTTQELTVARLAAAGNTNAEIGATMFISINTVDYHLRKVFQKLGISSRRQLTDRLPEAR